MKQVFKNILHKLYYVVVIVLLLLTLTQIATWFLNKHHAFFDQWASKQLNATVKVGKLNATWYGLSPQIQFNDVIITDNQQRQVARIRNLQLGIDVLHSLWGRQLLLNNITISGANIIARQDSNNNFQISSIDTSNTDQTNNAVDFNNTLAWLQQQPKLFFQNIRIQWYSPDGLLTPIFIKKLGIFNSNDEHKVYGVVNLTAGGELNNFILTAKGDLTKFQAIDAKLYLDLHNLPLSNWITKKYLKNYQLISGTLNTQLWAQWKDNQWQYVHGLVDLAKINLSRNVLSKIATVPASATQALTKFDNTFRLKKLAANFYWNITPTGWQLSADKVSLITEDEGILPTNAFSVKVSAEQQTFQFDYLVISQARKWLTTLQLLPKDWQKLLNEIQPTGTLNNVSLFHRGDWETSNDYQLITEFNNFSIKSSSTLPGINGLTGAISIRADQGKATITSENVEVDLTKLNNKPFFTKKLSFDALETTLSWQKQADDSWLMMVEELAAFNDDIAIDSQVAIIIPENNRDIFINTSTGVQFASAKQIKQYLPIGVMDKDFTQWIKSAFPDKGQAATTLLLRGKIKDFPFAKAAGAFSVDFDAKDLDFNYADNWPIAHQTKGSFNITNGILTANIKEANLLKTRVSNLNATVNNIGLAPPSVLHLSAALPVTAAELWSFLRASPLNDDAKPITSKLILTGNSKLDLVLNMPLAKPANIKINGKLELLSNNLSVADLSDASVQKITGNLLFSENKFWSENLQGILFKQLTKLVIKTTNETNPKTKTYHLLANGKLNTVDIKKYFALAQFNEIDGAAPYNMELQFRNQLSGDQQHELKLTSDLEGININLPMPLAKPKKAKLPFTLKVFFGAENKFVVGFDFDRRFSMLSGFQRQKNKFTFFNAAINFGGLMNEIKLSDKPGFYIGGYLPTLKWGDWNPWFDYFKSKNLGTSTLKEEENIKQLISRINLKIGTASLWHYEFKPLTIDIVPVKGMWQVKLDSKPMVGDLFIPDDVTTGKLTGNFSLLDLDLLQKAEKPKLKEQQESSKFSINDIPSADIYVTNFKYRGHSYGEMDLEIKRHLNWLEISHLSFSSPLMNMEASGSWKKTSSGQDTSHVQGYLVSKNMGQLLKANGITSSIIMTDANIKFNLTWPGIIYLPKISVMNGDINITAGKGAIINLGKEAEAKLNLGKILTLLDIGRIITLNFSDLNTQGYAFDKFNGAANLLAGRVFISNASFDGPTAGIDCDGTVNLNKKLLDLNLEVTPYVTSSIPLAVTLVSGLFTGGISWAIGGATWVAGKVLAKPIGKLVGHKYTIKGNWSSPVIKEISAATPQNNANKNVSMAETEMTDEET